MTATAFAETTTGSRHKDAERDVLLTGATGYIGTAVRAALPGVMPCGAVPRLDQQRWLHRAQWGTVIHLACDTLGGWPNIPLTVDALSTTHRGGRFVFASSITAQAPHDAYDRAKALCERIIDARPDVTAVVLRLCSVYGPGPLNQRSALNRMIAQAAGGHDLACFGNCAAVRDWTYVDDIVEAFRLALHAPAGTYEVGTGQAHTLIDAAQEVARQAGVRCSISPDATAVHHPIAQEGAWLPGWAPKVSLAEGIVWSLEAARLKAATHPAPAGAPALPELLPYG